MAVPAGLADHVVTLHRSVTRKDVLKSAGLNMVGAGSTVCCGWPLVESPRRPPLALGHGCCKCSLGFPQGEHLMLKIAQVHRGRYHFVHFGALFSEKDEVGDIFVCVRD